MITTQQATEWGTLLGIFLVAFMTQWNARRARRIARSAVEEARGYVARQSQRMGEIHSLVNGAMGRALRTIMILAREKADVTQHPTDIAAAEQAERDYDEHMIRQRLTEQSQISFKAGQESERAKNKMIGLAPEKIPGTTPMSEVKIVKPKEEAQGEPLMQPLAPMGPLQPGEPPSASPSI